MSLPVSGIPRRRVAIAIPIVLHLLRRDVAPEVPFTRRPAAAALAGRAVAAAAAARSAAARGPRRRAAAPGGGIRAAVRRRCGSGAVGLRIVAIDRSFSMGAPGRFQRAIEIATKAINETPFGERVALVAFDERADIVAPPGSAADARSALSGLAAGSGATRYGAMLMKASELATGGAATLVIVTDLQRAGWDGDTVAHVPATMKIDVRAKDGPEKKISVSALAVDDETVNASVRKASNNERSGNIILRHNAAEVTRASFRVGTGATVDVPFAWKRAAGGTITASIEDPSGYAADNSRHEVLHGALAPSVMVISSKDAPGQYLFRALDAAAAGTSADLKAQSVTADQIAGGRVEAIERQAAIVLLSTRTLDRAAREAIVRFVREGGGLLVAASPDVEPAMVATMFGWNAADLRVDTSQRQVSLAATDLRHPVFRPFGSLAANLGQVRFQQAWRVNPDGWQVPARFSDGSAAVLERAVGAGKVLLFASDLDRRWN